jgi:hypothetical protein
MEKRPCDRIDCCNEGVYPAPRKPSYDSMKAEKYLFCLEHVRAYNAAWNFFGGMSAEEALAYQKTALAGERRTRPVHLHAPEVACNAAFRHPPHTERAEKDVSLVLPRSAAEHLRVLGLNVPAEWDAVRKQYKKLAKRYHPDAGPDADEERFKRLGTAYAALKRAYGPAARGA